MIQIALIGVAAGAASALLFASFASGSLLSIPLFYLAPLPVLIVALGWSHVAGLIAALFASAALAAIFGGFFFMAFLIGIGLPAWWLGYLALLARSVGNGSGEALEWFPVGRLVVWAAAIAAAIVLAVMLTIASDADELRTTLRRAFEPLLTRGGRVEPSARSFVRMLIEYPHLVLPPAAAVLTTLVTVFTLWLAGRVVRISGRLRRPWPDIPGMTFPLGALAALGAAVLIALVGSGMAGIVGSIASAALLTAFGLLGLAVTHSLTRGMNARGLMLTAAYGSIVVFGWPLLGMAALGLADMLFGLRGRTVSRPPPPPTI